MGGQSSQTQQANQTTTTNPFAPAVPLVTNVANAANNLVGSAGLTPDEQQALDQLRQQAQGGNPYLAGIGNFATQALSGGGQQQFMPQVSSALDAYRQQLTPFATGANGSNPFASNLLSTIQNQVGNQVNPAFAGAGRDLSPANSAAYGSGVAQAFAPLMFQQHNTDVQNQLNAINSLYSGGLSGIGALSGLQQGVLGNMGTGVSAADAALAAAQQPAQSLLNIGQIQRGVPLSTLGQLTNIGATIGGLGGTSNMVGSQVTTKNPSLVENVQGWTKALSNLGWAPLKGGLPIPGGFPAG